MSMPLSMTGWYGYTLQLVTTQGQLILPVNCYPLAHHTPTLHTENEVCPITALGATPFTVYTPPHTHTLKAILQDSPASN